MRSKNNGRDTYTVVYFLLIVTCSLFSVGCSLGGSTSFGRSDEVRARFDPESSDNSEEKRAEQLNPILDSVAEQMWLSDTGE